MAQLEGVREQIQTIDINLRKESLSLSAHLVHGCRFLDRRLLPRIRDEILEPNGLFVWSTFLQGSPRVRNGRSLEPGELRRLFVEDVPASEAFQVCGLPRVYTHHVGEPRENEGRHVFSRIGPLPTLMQI